MTEQSTWPSSAENVRVSELSMFDEVGTLFVGDEVMLRGIADDHIDEVKALMECGLIQELVGKKLFPETEISSREMPPFNLVMSHRKITPLIFPHEWSPEMTRAAGLLVLQVNAIANKYGYELKDSHAYNVVFDGSQPMFVDFGSITKIATPGHWTAYKQFLYTYVYTLRLAERKMIEFYSQAFLYNGNRYGFEPLMALNPLLSSLGYRWTRRLHKWGYMWQRRGLRLRRFASEYDESSYLGRMVLASVKVLEKLIAPDENKQLAKKLKRLRFESKTTWGSYHEVQNFYDEHGNIALSERMAYIADWVKKLSPKTIIEFGGNQGILSRKLAEYPEIESIICSDYDSVAVDKLFLNLGAQQKITPAYFDFVMGNSATSAADRCDRLKSDIVIALALTHHLLLSQKISLRFIVDRFAQYSSEYLITEFMPLGLWNGIGAPPLPAWYTEEWYIGGIERKFEILERKQCEENRIVYVCRKK